LIFLYDSLGVKGGQSVISTYQIHLRRDAKACLENHIWAHCPTQRIVILIIRVTCGIRCWDNSSSSTEHVDPLATREVVESIVARCCFTVALIKAVAQKIGVALCREAANIRSGPIASSALKLVLTDPLYYTGPYFALFPVFVSLATIICQCKEWQHTRALVVA